MHWIELSETGIISVSGWLSILMHWIELSEMGIILVSGLLSNLMYWMELSEMGIISVPIWRAIQPYAPYGNILKQGYSQYLASYQTICTGLNYLKQG